MLRRFSNWARRDETGFMDEPSMCWSGVLASMLWAPLSAGARWDATAAHRPPGTASHWALAGATVEVTVMVAVVVLVVTVVVVVAVVRRRITS